MLYLTISSACPTTGSYEHVLGVGVTLTLVDEVALFVFISWSCANIIDGVYNPTVTVNLKGVESSPALVVAPIKVNFGKGKRIVFTD